MMPDRIRTALEFLQRYTLADASAEPGSARQSIRRYTIAGVALVAFLTLGVGVWATTVEMAGALIAPGTVVVESNIKKVQHLTGGVVGELRVKDGDRVKAGDLLVRLDDTITRANLAIVTKTLTELTARKARLSAERDGSGSIAFPEELLREVDVPDVAQVMAAEVKLFDLRRSARAGQKSQLRERINQANEEIVGFGSQKAAKDKEIGFIEHELTGVRDLYQKNLVPITRLSQLEREATRLGGERGQLIAATAQAKGKIAELQLQIIQVDQDLSSEVAKEMREIDARIGEFIERKRTRSAMSNDNGSARLFVELLSRAFRQRSVGVTLYKLLECICRSAPARQLVLFLQRNVRIALRAHFACAALMPVDRRAIVCHYRNPSRTKFRSI